MPRLLEMASYPVCTCGGVSYTARGLAGEGGGWVLEKGWQRLPRRRRVGVCAARHALHWRVVVTETVPVCAA